MRRRVAGLVVGLCVATALPSVARAGEIVAIVNSDNASSRMTLHQLRLLYGLYQRTWPGGGRVELLVPEAGSAAMDYLVQMVFRKAIWTRSISSSLRPAESRRRPSCT